MESQSSISSIRRSIKDVSIRAFREAYYNKDFSYLVISGAPTLDELSDAWQSILNEYSDAISTSDSSYLFKLDKNIQRLKAELVYIDNVVELLRIKRIQQHIDELAELGYFGEFSETDKDAYLRDVNRVVSLAKNKIPDLAELEEEYAALTNVKEKKSDSEAEFNKTVAALSKYVGHQLDYDRTFMDHYCAVFNLYLMESESSKKQEVENG